MHGANLLMIDDVGLVKPRIIANMYILFRKELEGLVDESWKQEGGSGPWAYDVRWLLYRFEVIWINTAPQRSAPLIDHKFTCPALHSCSSRLLEK